MGSLILEGEALFKSASLFYGHGTECAYDEALYIVLSITGNLPLVDNTVFGRVVDEATQRRIHILFQQRIEEKLPAAYLLGEAWFAGLPFFVDESVLVPRSPFAELIADGFAPWVEKSKTKTILDLCTGSGCIGTACAVQFPEAEVDISDISKTALRVANKNIVRHGLESRVNVIESDLYVGLRDKQYDFGLCR